MPNLLDIQHIRSQLIRQEETLIFGVIERAQFALNPVIYKPGAFGPALGDESLMGHLLRETECIHAKMRRYTSPDEHPFTKDLPEPLLPSLAYPDNPLKPHVVNVNELLRKNYEEKMVPLFCREGDDGQYGSSAVHDVALLQALSKRIHYGTFVAESKYQADPARFNGLIQAGDYMGILKAVEHREVEEALLERVRMKAETYGQLLAQGGPFSVEPNTLHRLYEEWIVPMNKAVQVGYLLQRGVD